MSRSKGFKHSEVTKDKIRKKTLGQFKNGMSEETKKKLSLVCKGIRRSPKTEFKKGQKAKNWNGFKKGIHPKTEFKKGHKNSEETMEKISLKLRGKNCYRYIDGRSYTKSPLRYGDDWSKVRMLIYERDNFTCQDCGLKMTNKTGAHDVHHKIPFLETFDNSLNNLTTLCRSCHMKAEWEIIKKQTKGGRLKL